VQARSDCHQIGESGLHLSHHLASMGLHCDLADLKLATDCLFNRPETTNAMTPVRDG
jgi:hypothetical protein